jgi:cytochrome c peroxidase
MVSLISRYARPRHWTICLLLIAHAAPAQQNIEPTRVPLGLPALSSSSHTAQRAWLGEQLFFDKKLSLDGKVSCGSCHLPQRAFTDGLPRALGHSGRSGTRNAPSLMNVAYATSLFWDGRARDLSAQARAPFTNPVEHALPSADALIAIIEADAAYSRDFAAAFPERKKVQMESVTDALLAFEHTLLAGNSAFDRYFYAKDATAMSPAAVRGLELFRGRANCISCHSMGPEHSLFTDQDFHVAARGLPSTVTRALAELAQRVVAAKNSAGTAELERLIATDDTVAALGRFVVTLDPADMGKFKTPSLRNVALTAPYMHDGSVRTLEEAVDLELYSRGAVAYPIVLTRSQQADLLAFLAALSSPPAPSVSPRIR